MALATLLPWENVWYNLYHMKNILLWRNRASAILGVMVMLLPFTYFPGWFKNAAFVVLGALITLFGLTISRRWERGVVTREPVSTDTTNIITEE